MTKNILLFLGALVILTLSISCGTHTESHQIHWREGDSTQELDKIKEQDWKTISKVEFAGYAIEQSKQIISGHDLQKTYFSKVTNLNSQNPFILSARYNTKGFYPLFSERANPEILIKQFIEAHSEYKQMKFLSIEKVFHQKGSVLISLWRAEFEDKTKVVEVLFSKNLDVFLSQVVSSDFSVKATVFPRGEKHSALTQVLFMDLLDWNTLSSPRVIVRSEIPGSRLNLKEELHYNPLDLKFDQVQAFYSLDSALAWFEKKFGYKPYRKLEVDTHINYPEKTNAAFYYSGKIRIGTGDDVSYSRIAQDPSIVIHEAVHSVIESVARLPVDGEGGSLNEAFADFFTCVQLQTPQLGEVAFKEAPYKRSLLTLVKFNERTGGLYHDSLILSGLLWSLHKELGETTSLKIASRLLVEMNVSSNFDEVRNILPLVLEDTVSANELKKAHKILTDRGFM